MEEGQAPEEQPELPVLGAAQGLTDQQPGQVPEAEGPQPGLPLLQIHAQSEQPQLGWNPPGPSWAGGDPLGEDAGTTGSGPPYTEMHAGIQGAIAELKAHIAIVATFLCEDGSWHSSLLFLVCEDAACNRVHFLLQCPSAAACRLLHLLQI